MVFFSRVIMSNIKKNFGNRKFYALPEDYALKTKLKTQASAKKEDSNKLIKYIDDNVIGKNTTFAGPFGRRKVVYCDYTASGRSLQFIEDYVMREVLPLYGNTHTTTTITSMQSTLFRHEARDIIRNAVHASEHDAVIFAGQGTTGAVHKLIHSLGLQQLAAGGAGGPVVFVGPCEHHSNLLPWREIGAKIVRISETNEGYLDLDDLEHQLQLQRALQGAGGGEVGGGAPLIGCFSAASNITGVLADDVATTLLLHQYGALAFWDYATAAPCVKLDMNPLLPGINESAASKDAIFFSGHKFVGGVQTPGVLVAKKALFKNPVPEGCGGGTVFFVSASGHRYLKDTETREEGGTAAIVESVRMGLAMQLKLNVGVANIMAREEKITKLVLSHLSKVPEVIVLGNQPQSTKRLAVFSFLVRHPRGAFLHHNLVCALLNDVFGIQARGGCACAGPYAQDLLGIDEDLAQQYENILLEDENLDRTHLRRREEHSQYELLRPGFARISLPYFMSDSEVLFVMEAVKMVATEGWKLMPQYVANPETGEWRHRSNSVFRERKWLGQIRYTDGKMSCHDRKVSGAAAASCPSDYGDCLQIARDTFNKARKMAQRSPLGDQSLLFPDRVGHLRWFMLPSEAQDLLLGRCANVKTSLPFVPPVCRLTPPATAFARHKSLSSLEISRNTAQRLEMRARADSFSPQMMSSGGEWGRGRCYSLGGPVKKRDRQISCSSQTDATDGGDCTPTGAERPAQVGTPPVVMTTTNNPQHLQAYMQEVSMSLATEIKSEIREVINTVEDVLDTDVGKAGEAIGNGSPPVVVVGPPVFDTGFDQQCMARSPLAVTVHPNYLQHRPLCSPTPSPLMQSSPHGSLSADHVAECLAELTGEMVNELKSEIREMVSQVDELISPPTPTNSSESGRTSSPETEKRMEDPGNSEASGGPDSECPEVEGGPEYVHRQLFKDARRSTVNSISSQDSGINLACERERDGDTARPRRDRDGDTSRPSGERDGASSPAKTVCARIGERQRAAQEQALKDSLGKPRWHCPPRNIWKPTTDAVKEFGMIRDGDRVLVCLSGGKDSLSLLHTLHQYQYYAASKGVHFTLGAATVDPGSDAYDPRPLIPYLAALGVHYLYEEQQIMDAATSAAECKSICSFCSRMKRGRLYAAARREGYNVLALGQHLDDLAESFLMSTFHNGRLRSMKAHYSIKERDLRVIRPFVFVRERSLRQFAESRHLPVIPENCPACFEAPKERYRTKQLLAQQEILFPRLYANIKAALRPLISFDRTGQESKVYKKAGAALLVSRPHNTDASSDTETEEESVSVEAAPVELLDSAKL